jgi:hypothetical protein
MGRVKHDGTEITLYLIEFCNVYLNMERKQHRKVEDFSISYSLHLLFLHVKIGENK